MTKKVRLFLTMLFLTLLGGANAAWADEVTISVGSSSLTWTADGANYVASSDGFSLEYQKGSYTNSISGGIQSAELRLYSGTNFVISSSYTITKIVYNVADGTGKNYSVSALSTEDGNLVDGVWEGSANSVTASLSAQNRIKSVTITYTSSGPVVQTVATPTFSPGGGDFAEAQDVTINCTTSGATIYYTTDGTAPTTSSSVYSSAISVEETTTIKAIAVKDGMNNSAVASATYTIITGGAGDSYVIDFENIAVFYTNWIFTNIVGKAQNSNVTAHGGSYFGNTNGKESGSIQTKEKIATPNSLTCYLSKQSTNTTPSSWKIQVSSDGETWTDVAETSAVDMTRGEWKEFSTDLSAYTDVYVRVYYSGTTAIRDIDDLTLVTTAPAVATPTFDPADGEYTEAQSVTITCATEGATIYYTTDGTDPSNQSTPYTGAIAVSETTTIKAIAYVGTDASSVATATYTIVEPLSLITIAEARAQQAEEEVLTAGIVTSVNGRTAYIQDNTAAIVVYGSSNLSVTIGDDITVQGTLSTYNGLLEITSPEITVNSQGNTVEPVVTAIADISNDNQAKLIKIENATVTAIDGKNVTIAQGDNNITVYFNSANDITFDVNDVITLTGNIGCYNTVQIANPTDITVTENVKYYLVGTMTNWQSNKAKFQRQADGTYKVEGQTVLNNDEFKIIKEEGSEGSSIITWYGGATDDGNNYVIHDEWYNNIPLTEGDAGKNFQIQANEECNFTFVLDVDNMTITVTGWPRKHYYVIGQGVGSLEGMQEMTYNEDKGVYELEVTFRDTDAPGYWFAISDLASASSWDELNNGHRYAVQEGDYTLTKENSRNVQLIKANGSMMVYNAGTYTLTLTEDRELTVTGWPIILDGNAFVKVTSTDDITDGYYLIVYEGDDSHKSVAFDGSLETLDDAFNTIDVTIAGQLIVANSTTNAAVFTIEGSTLKSASGKYIGRTSNSNGLNEHVATEYENTFSIDEDGNAVITSSAGPTLRFNYGSNDLRFRYYKSGQQPIALYKLTTVEEIPVTISSAEYATLYYSDKAFVIPEGVTASIVTSTEGGKITFDELSGVIPAGTAVVLNGPQGTYDFKVVNDETVAPANNLLRGFDESHLTEGGDVYYKLTVKNGKVGFYWGEENGEAFESGAHKAYLALPAGGAGAKSFYLFSDAVTDGIGAVESTRFNAQGTEIYNLNGQRVSTPQRGIYIINGKKVLVK